jgi:hypothetical protein
MKSAARATVTRSGWQIAIYRPGGRGREGRGPGRRRPMTEAKKEEEFRVTF